MSTASVGHAPGQILPRRISIRAPFGLKITGTPALGMNEIAIDQNIERGPVAGAFTSLGFHADRPFHVKTSALLSFERGMSSIDGGVKY